jgi:hypothetical protein
VADRYQLGTERTVRGVEQQQRGNLGDGGDGNGRYQGADDAAA